MKSILLSAAVFVAAAPALAQSEELTERQAERAVDTRQSVVKLLAWNLGPLGGMARGLVDFDAERAQTHGARILALAGMMEDAFATDTRGADVETEALDKIWADAAGFDAKIAGLMEAAQAFVTAAESGDKDTTLAAVRPLGQSCGACHDAYREE
ncbi:MAG: c-type cytochrome [Maricaulaceae bacterium]